MVIVRERVGFREETRTREREPLFNRHAAAGGQDAGRKGEITPRAAGAAEVGII